MNKLRPNHGWEMHENNQPQINIETYAIRHWHTSYFTFLVCMMILRKILNEMKVYVSGKVMFSCIFFFIHHRDTIYCMYS